MITRLIGLKIAFNALLNPEFQGMPIRYLCCVHHR